MYDGAAFLNPPPCGEGGRQAGGVLRRNEVPPQPLPRAASYPLSDCLALGDEARSSEAGAIDRSTERPAGQRGYGGARLPMSSSGVCPWTNHRLRPASPMTYPSHHPRPPAFRLQLPRFRRRSVSRDVRGQAGAGALIGPVTCRKGQGGESHGVLVERRAFLSSLPLATGPGSVEPFKWQDLPKGDRERSHAARRGDHL